MTKGSDDATFILRLSAEVNPQGGPAASGTRLNMGHPNSLLTVGLTS